LPKKKNKCTCPEILAVDDDSFNMMAIESILQSMGFHNNRAFNGKEGVDKALSRALNPCKKGECDYYKMIFVDCTMPIMNGFEAALILKTWMKEKKIPCTPIIACTALAQTSDIQAALTAGMDDYCIKPLSKEKIRNLMIKFELSVPEQR
jgi:CheY-like chemotaxis protein